MMSNLVISPSDKIAGKRNRGLSVIGSLRHLVGPAELKSDDIRTAIVLGWCVEMVSRHYTVHS